MKSINFTRKVPELAKLQKVYLSTLRQWAVFDHDFDLKKRIVTCKIWCSFACMNLTCQTVWHTQPSGKMPLTLYVKEQVLSRNTWQEIGRTLFNWSDQQTIWLIERGHRQWSKFVNLLMNWWMRREKLSETLFVLLSVRISMLTFTYTTPVAASSSSSDRPNHCGLATGAYHCSHLKQLVCIWLHFMLS